MFEKRILRLAIPVVALMAALAAGGSAQAGSGRAHFRPCGSYVDAGSYTGTEDKRVFVANRHMRCKGAIGIVRTFRSFLPKHHHGGPGSDSWAIPSAPGWVCREIRHRGKCWRRHRIARFEVKAPPKQSRCRHSVPVGTGSVAFLAWRRVGCDLRKRLGRALGIHGRWRSHGFTCRRLALRAGGGGALCQRKARFLEVGFE